MSKTLLCGKVWKLKIALQEWQILVTEFWSRWMTAFVAVCLTLISPYIFKIMKSFLIWIFGFLSWLATEWSSAQGPEPSSLPTSTRYNTPLLQEQTPNYGGTHSERPETADFQTSNAGRLGASQNTSSNHDSNVNPYTNPQTMDLETRTQSVHGIGTPINMVVYAENSRETVWNFFKYLLHSGAKQVESPSIIMVVLSTVLFGLFVAQAIAGVFSAKIASDRTGLSSSNYCGIWQFDDNAGAEAADRDDPDNYQKEARASQYARNCYNSPDSTSTLSCKIFYNQSIAFTTKTHQPCPFSSSELCLDGLYSAVTFDTGLVEVSTIGINSLLAHKFRRITTCSPINMSEPYVKGPSQGANDTTYRYYYGPKDNADYTFKTSGHPFEWLVPVYSVK